MNKRLFTLITLLAPTCVLADIYNLPETEKIHYHQEQEIIEVEQTTEVIQTEQITETKDQTTKSQVLTEKSTKREIVDHSFVKASEKITF